MSYTLLIDCSDTNLSIGVSKDSNLVYKKSFYAWQRQSEYMIPEIKLAMETLGMNINDISTIALGIGPGSYTGIRIPLTIAKTLAVINKAKVIPLSSLQIMGNHDEKYIALMNARSNRSYIGIYENGQKVIDDKIINNENEFPKVFSALSFSPFPKKMEALGAAPILTRAANAEISIIRGKHTPTPVSANLPTFAICPIYIRSTKLYNKLIICAAIAGTANLKSSFPTLQLPNSSV